MTRRTEEIKAKGFDMGITPPTIETAEEFQPLAGSVDYSQIRVGLKTLDNALTDINYYKKINPKADKETVLKTIRDGNQAQMRELSEFFYKTSGIYARLVKYMAGFFRYDWVVTPIIISDKVKAEKVTEGFYKSLLYLDAFNAKKVFGEIAIKVVRQGVYYGYQIKEKDRVILQELPVSYCRSRFFANGKPVVEFNMRYFDDTFRDTNQRIKILKVFPVEFQRGYIAYKEGKLQPDYTGDQQGWYMLDVANTVKFNINGEDTPTLISVIPSIIDLEEAKELDRKKMQQQLLKIIIQKMPLDKNGELVFDVDEAKALHNNAVAMLGDTIGVDVLTTFAEVDVADLAERSTVATMDELGKVERAIFNEAGVSQMQFNTDGNLALEKSVANDESSLTSLILQFEAFLNELLEPFNKNRNKLYYKAEILGTTIYNYKDLAKLYKEQMTIGFSKILPQVALGQSQSSILATAYFENEILNLNELFTPPASSNTTSGGEKKKSSSTDGPGRKPLDDDEKSEKTIRNKESMS